MEGIERAAAALIVNADADLTPNGKTFCDNLTAEQWRVARGKTLTEREIETAERLADHQHFSDKPHSRQRLYELAKMARLGNAMTSDTDLSEVVAGLRADVADGVNVPSAFSMLGACSIAGGSYELGAYYFNKSNQITARNSCITAFMSLSRAVPSLSIFDCSIGYSRANELCFEGKPVSFRGGPVSVVAGNSVYINRFIENYARSIASNSSGAFSGVHVHWVRDEGEDEHAIMAAMSAARAHGVDINQTTETLNGVFDKKSYYAQSRFLIARRLLDFYQKPLMITDLDFQLCASPRNAIAKLELIDVSFLQHKACSVMWAFPWLRSMAGSVWVNNTAKGREFCRLIEHGFYSCFNPAWFNWGIDQNLLTSVLEYMRNGAGLNFASMTDVSSCALFEVPVELKAGVKSM